MMNTRAVGPMLLVCAALLTGCVATNPDAGDLSPPQSPTRRANLHADLAGSYMRRGQMSVALDEANQALSIQSGNPAANYVMAVLQAKLGRDSEAEHYFRRAIDAKKNYSDAEHEYAVFLCSQGRPDEAFQWFDKVLADPLYRNRALASVHAGECMLKEKKPNLTAAARYIDTALKADPEMPAALFAMARVQYALGNGLPARAYIERFFATGEQTPQALLLGVKIEHSMGSDDVAAKYAKQLQTKYPDSPQAAQAAQFNLTQ